MTKMFCTVKVPPRSYSTLNSTKTPVDVSNMQLTRPITRLVCSGITNPTRKEEMSTAMPPKAISA